MKALHVALFVLVLFSGCSYKQQSAPPIEYEHYKHSNKELYDLYEEFQKWKGVPNVYGGTTKEGVDCSSLIQQVMYDVYGIMLPRTTYSQLKVGKKITIDELKTGDLLFFKTSKKTNHVGIYLEKGTFMHSSTKYGVSIARVESTYWSQHYLTSRRVIR